MFNTISLLGQKRERRRRRWGGRRRRKGGEDRRREGERKETVGGEGEDGTKEAPISKSFSDGSGEPTSDRKHVTFP